MEKETISIIASGYDISCSCGAILGTSVQLDVIGINDGGMCEITCLCCGTTHFFDGSNIDHAF